MIDFKVGNTVFDYHNFAKHHKRMPIMIGRTHGGGRYEDLVISDDFRKDIEDNAGDVFEAARKIYNRQTDTLEDVMDKFIWAKNTQYIDDEVTYYATRIMNTRQTTYVRLKFQFENARAYLDYKFDTSGSYAMPFDSLCGHGFIETIINDAIEESKNSLQETGFAVTESGDYQVIIVSDDGEVVDAEMPMFEIESGFIGIEVYKFEQEIISDEELKKLDKTLEEEIQEMEDDDE